MKPTISNWDIGLRKWSKTFALPFVLFFLPMTAMQIPIVWIAEYRRDLVPDDPVYILAIAGGMFTVAFVGAVVGYYYSNRQRWWISSQNGQLILRDKRKVIVQAAIETVNVREAWHCRTSVAGGDEDVWSHSVMARTLIIEWPTKTIAMTSNTAARMKKHTNLGKEPVNPYYDVGDEGYVFLLEAFGPDFPLLSKTLY